MIEFLRLAVGIAVVGGVLLILAVWKGDEVR